MSQLQSSFNLYDNNLTERSASAISDLTISCRAKTLSVSGNETVGEDASLYRVISDDSSMLEELYMWSTKLSSGAAIELYTALSEAKKLKVLEITKNDVTGEACDSITGVDLEILGRDFLTTAMQWWSSNFTAIFDGNSRFLLSIDLEKFYGQLIKNFEMEGFLGTPETPLKPPLHYHGSQDKYLPD